MYEDGTDFFEEYEIGEDFATRATNIKAGNEWVAMPGSGKDGQLNYGEGGRIPVPLSEVAMVLEKVARFLPPRNK